MVIDFAARKGQKLADAERAQLRARIDKLKARQVLRIAAVEDQKRALDASVERAAMKIVNLEAQLGEER